MSKYHVNPTTGIPGLCSARISCPFGGDADHFDSPQGAMEYHEMKLAEELDQPKSLTRESVQSEESKESASDPASNFYDFPAYKLAYAINSIEKANRRAKKAGIEGEITYELEEYPVSTLDENGMQAIEERVKLTLNKPVLKHDGWTFSGTMTWDDEVGLVTRMVPGETLLEDPKAKVCDVCNTTRHRTDTYIVQKDGQQLQVGSNCLKQFMGIRPAGLWMLEYELDLKEGNEDSVASWSNRGEVRRDSKELIGLGLAVAETYGWTSKAAAYDKPSTSERIDHLLYGNMVGEGEKKERARLIARGKELQKEAEEVLADARTVEGFSDYAQNLRTVASGETVGSRNTALLLSAIGHSERKKEKERRRQAAGNSEWVGVVDQKITLPEVKIEHIKQVSSSNGYRETFSQLITFKDDSGNIFKTFYGGSNTPKVGDSMVLKSAVIKKHQEWNDVKETMVGRVKFESIRPTTAPPTTLRSESPYVDAWTVEENTKINKAQIRKNKQIIKKKAGPDGWDSNWDRPINSDLIKEWDELDRITNREYGQRHGEITGED